MRWANELSARFQGLGLDPFEVLEAAATKPFGFAPFTPGPGPGGPCIPDVTRFLEPTGEEELIGAVQRAHERVPGAVVQRLSRALDERRILLRTARVLVLGVAYKPGVADVRGSAGVRLLELLRAEGCEVAYHDPLVERVAVPGGRSWNNHPLGPGESGRFDAVVALHASRETVREVAEHARFVLDTTGCLREAMGGGARWLPG